MSNELIIIICIIGVAVLLCLMLAVANFAGEKFFEKYREIDKIEAYTDLSPFEYFNFLNKKYFNGKIQVIPISVLAGDAYGKGKLFLNTDTLNKKSLASYTIISHELGHAKQDRDGKKLKRLHFLKKMGRFLGLLMFPSLIAGVILFFIGDKLFLPGIFLLATAGLIFLLALIIKLITISIEKEASKNAVEFLKEIFDGKQLKQCKSFLKDAKLTYWADFFRTLFIWTALSKQTKLFN